MKVARHIKPSTLFSRRNALSRSAGRGRFHLADQLNFCAMRSDRLRRESCRKSTAGRLPPANLDQRQSSICETATGQNTACDLVRQWYCRSCLEAIWTELGKRGGCLGREKPLSSSLASSGSFSPPGVLPRLAHLVPNTVVKHLRAVSGFFVSCTYVGQTGTPRYLDERLGRAFSASACTPGMWPYKSQTTVRRERIGNVSTMKTKRKRYRRVCLVRCHRCSDLREERANPGRYMQRDSQRSGRTATL